MVKRPAKFDSWFARHRFPLSQRSDNAIRKPDPLLKNVTYANIKVVEGYTGTSGIRAALQRKEADGACWQWDSMKTTAQEMLEAKGDDRLIPFIMEGEADAGGLIATHHLFNAAKPDGLTSHLPC
jgi:hypothetical protein